MRKEISNIIKEWKDDANVKGVVLVGVYADFRDTIRICTDKPGLMIGKGGELFDKYKKKLKEFNQNLEHIEFVETDSWYIRWIPFSEQLPEEDEKVYISTKTERVYVGVYTKRYGFEKREGFICDDGFMWMNTALAWKPYVLPAPYQPKGE